MKKIIFISLLILIQMRFIGQTYNDIYGLVRNTSTQDVSLARTNPSTGTITMISTVPFGVGFYGNTGSSVDPMNKIFYTVTSNKTLFGVNLLTGNIISSPTVAAPPSSSFDQISFNNSDTTLYGVVRYIPSQNFYLSKINVLTGAITIISPTSLPNGNSNPTIDAVNKIYYSLSSGKLYGLNLSTGNAISSPSVTLPCTSCIFDQMHYCCSDSTLYGLLRQLPNQDLKLAKINSLTGSVTAISAFPFSTSYSGNAGSTLDPINKIYYIQSTGGLFGIDLTSGIPVSTTTLNLPSSSLFDQNKTDLFCSSLVTTINLNKPIENNFKIYPNPTNNSICINEKISESFSIIITNSIGEIVQKIESNDVDDNYKLENLKSGCYILKIIDKSNMLLAVERIIIN
jgi:hypothetical protein